MPQYCTILCPADEPARVVNSVRDLIGDRGVITVTGDEANWSSVSVQHGDVSLVLNRLIPIAPGDDFARMQYGISMYFENVETVHSAIKFDLLECIEAFTLAIGVVAEPAFAEDSGHFECIFGLAADLGAIVWNGNGVLDAEGNMILDAEGNSEVAS